MTETMVGVRDAVSETIEVPRTVLSPEEGGEEVAVEQPSEQPAEQPEDKPAEAEPTETETPSDEESKGDKPDPEDKPQEAVDKPDDEVAIAKGRDASRFAALARKEREIREREKKAKEYEERLRAFEEREELAKKDPIKALEAFGWDYEKATERVLNDGNVGPNEQYSSLQEKIDALESKLSEYESTSKQKERQQNINNLKGAIKNEIETNAEKWEYLNAYSDQAVDVVYSVMDQIYAKSGRVPSLEEAAQLANEYYEQDTLERVRRLKRFKGHFESEDSKEKPSTVAKESRPKTITNKQETTAPPRQKRKLTREESLAEAAKLIRWTDD